MTDTLELTRALADPPRAAEPRSSPGLPGPPGPSGPVATSRRVRRSQLWGLGLLALLTVLGGCRPRRHRTGPPSRPSTSRRSAGTTIRSA